MSTFLSLHTLFYKIYVSLLKNLFSGLSLTTSFVLSKYRFLYLWYIEKTIASTFISFKKRYFIYPGNQKYQTVFCRISCLRLCKRIYALKQVTLKQFIVKKGLKEGLQWKDFLQFREIFSEHLFPKNFGWLLLIIVLTLYLMPRVHNCKTVKFVVLQC